MNHTFEQWVKLNRTRGLTGPEQDKIVEDIAALASENARLREALEAVQSEIMLDGQLDELVTAALAKP